jgi:hypothetical protein
MLERTSDAGGVQRAFLRIGGITLARQQLGLTLMMHCERVICIAPALGPELVELQHLAEAAGARFHVVAGPRALAGLITAADEIIAIGDGLFASSAEAAALLEQGQAVLTQPIEQGLSAGFERIDLNTSAAAAMRVPGRLVAQLAELPADCDAVSALQRIALQAGVAQRAIPAPGTNGLFWTLLRSDGEAHALEPQWIRQRTDDAERVRTPGRLLALLGVRAFGPALLEAGGGAGALFAAAVATTAMGMGAGWFGFVGPGLALCALAWILLVAFALLERIHSDHSVGRSRIPARGLILAWALDAALVALAGWGSAEVPGLPWFERYFPPLMLFAVLRLVPKALATRWTAWLDDRVLVAAAIAAGVAMGHGGAVLHGAALLVAAAGILLPRGEVRLTRP